MHGIRTIVIDDRGVRPSVRLSVTRLNSVHCATTAERIKVLFGVKALEGPRNTVRRGSSPTTRGGETKSTQPLRNHFGLVSYLLASSSLSRPMTSSMFAVAIVAGGGGRESLSLTAALATGQAWRLLVVPPGQVTGRRGGGSGGRRSVVTEQSWSPRRE